MIGQHGLSVFETWRAAFDHAWLRARIEGQAMKVEKFHGHWWIHPALTEPCS